MKKGSKLVAIMTVIVLILSLSVQALACRRGATTPTASAPGGGLVVQSDSIISGKIMAIRRSATGYPWEIDVLIQSSEDVGSLPNPTKDKVGQTVTCRTDENVEAWQAGRVITAHVKYVGDVPKPGITLYIFDIKPI